MASDSDEGHELAAQLKAEYADHRKFLKSMVDSKEFGQGEMTAEKVAARFEAHALRVAELEFRLQAFKQHQK
ncbi:hypothetical protein [Pseudoduganella lurida]|uniref:hypothetical protein n=1 Tax=Pseudoduganella lurida TaxID=1036180 RepID=UPI0011A49C94|nr:hypothetical protein [Pseudoduganella lurida]